MSGLVKYGGVKFMVYPEDHEPRHVHGFVGSNSGPEVVIDLRADGAVALAARKDAIRGATRAEVRKVERAAKVHFDELVALWDEMHAQ